ncbi:hypothetical protein K439DRAFT_1160535 [Ramaria rubella]|nr:hypothetical protein K439DRAFT_1160535 [Ramaria rubella]
MFSVLRLSYLPHLTSSLRHLPSQTIHVVSRPESSVSFAKLRVAGKLVQQKAGKRGGQNLTNRDIRLSKSIRQKQAFSRVGLPEAHALDPSFTRGELVTPREDITLAPRVKTFRGMTIPDKPRPPESDECCMSGCAICVYDMYLTSLEAYRESIYMMRSALRAQGVPNSEWPREICENEGVKDGSTGQDPPPELDVSMSAFAELEKRLRATNY